MQINRIIRFDPDFLMSSQRGRLSVVCDAALQRTSVSRVAAQQVGYFENSHGKTYRAVDCGFLGYFYNVPRPAKVYVDK